MTKEELSLLLYLETRAVDHGGLVDVAHMNDSDMNIAERWDETGYLSFRRLKLKEANRLSNGQKHITHLVSLPDGAFCDAHAERKARAKRMAEARKYETVGA